MYVCMYIYNIYPPLMMTCYLCIYVFLYVYLLAPTC